MEIVKLFHKEYEVKEKPDGTLILKPITRPTDKRASLKEYSTQELVDEVWERCEEDIRREREDEELWKDISFLEEES